jgi:Tfp pilus assembly protein PilF
MLAAVGLCAAVIVAYHNTLSGPFVFDDPLAITENPTIRQLWPLTDVLLPPRGEGLSVEGRPVLNLTLALNHAIGGTAVRGYHVFNILIHALATLTLFGVVRRTLLLPRMQARFGGSALPLATVVALLWAVHPLQTESVTYVIQRAESLVALFYLLTFYCFLRGISFHVLREKTAGARTGFGLAVGACLVGMATKEVMVSAPLMILLFDRAFVAGTFGEAWRRRRWVHAGLFATWILLAVLAIRTGTRGGTAGFGINVTPWDYALTQFEAVTRYVWLSFWPHPLILDYGTEWVRHVADVLPYALVLLTLTAGTVVAWWRWPAVAFLGILFFAVLSPTSSIVPGNRQTLAEHRMYLPLAAVIVLVVCSGHLVVRESASRRGLGVGAMAIAVAWSALTLRRNEDYRSVLTLYRDTVDKRPNNGFARYNLAKVYAENNRHAEAIVEYEHSLRLMPGLAPVHNNLGNSLLALGRTTDARAQFETAIRLDPKYAHAYFNLGNLRLRDGAKEDAARHFQAAVTVDTGHVEARTNLAGVLLELGRLDEAREQFDRVLRAKPDSIEARFGLGNVHLLQRRWAEAGREFEAVLRARPDLSIARERLEQAKREAGR